MFKYSVICKRFCLLSVNLLSVNPTKWSNTLRQFVGYLSKNCLSVFDHFVGLALKGFIPSKKSFLLH